MNTADKKKIFTAAANLKNDCIHAQLNEGCKDTVIFIGVACNLCEDIMTMINAIDATERQEGTHG